MNKDKDKRPSIFDIAQIPCISRKIEEFIKIHDCKDEVMAFFDVDPIKTKSKKKDKNEIQNYVIEQLENWAEIMRGEINIKDYPNGWFGKHLRCAQGQDIYGWILEHVEEDNKKGGIIC